MRLLGGSFESEGSNFYRENSPPIEVLLFVVFVADFFCWRFECVLGFFGE